jgi:hypothetical protein
MLPVTNGLAYRAAAGTKNDGRKSFIKSVLDHSIPLYPISKGNLVGQIYYKTFFRP